MFPVMTRFLMFWSVGYEALAGLNCPASPRDACPERLTAVTSGFATSTPRAVKAMLNGSAATSAPSCASEVRFLASWRTPGEASVFERLVWMR